MVSFRSPYTARPAISAPGYTLATQLYRTAVNIICWRLDSYSPTDTSQWGRQIQSPNPPQPQGLTSGKVMALITKRKLVQTLPRENLLHRETSPMGLLPP